MSQPTDEMREKVRNDPTYKIYINNLPVVKQAFTKLTEVDHGRMMQTRSECFESGAMFGIQLMDRIQRGLDVEMGVSGARVFRVDENGNELSNEDT